MRAHVVTFLTALVLAGCTTAPARLDNVAVAETRAVVTILVSIDGFRPDYLARGVTPHLSRLAASGVSASMRPSFPSNTFPNHYTLVTGLRPDRHGIVGNRMEDPARPGIVFTMASDEPVWWTQAEPIWVTAERAGVRSATGTWPGANVDFGGTRPRDWHPYGQAVSERQRVDNLIDWLRRPAATRPRFLTLYFDTVDTAGHTHGPDSPETNTAVNAVDAQIGHLTAQLATLSQPANLVIVADHGMTSVAPTNVIKLYELAAPTDYRAIYSGPYAGIDAQPGRQAALAAALLRPHPNMECARKADLPPALHYGRNPRVPAFICLARVGWTILAAPLPPERTSVKRGGQHGYDPAHPDMAALFIAHGPAFREGMALPAFDNVHVYPLLAQLLGVTPRPGDGDLAVLGPAIKP